MAVIQWRPETDRPSVRQVLQHRRQAFEPGFSFGGLAAVSDELFGDDHMGGIAVEPSATDWRGDNLLQVLRSLPPATTICRPWSGPAGRVGSAVGAPTQRKSGFASGGHVQNDPAFDLPVVHSIENVVDVLHFVGGDRGLYFT